MAEPLARLAHGLPSAAVLACLPWLLACARPPQAPVYDLAYSFPVAEIKRDWENLDLGTEAARSHLFSGWSWDERASDGTTFVWTEGTRSVLELPIVQPRAGTLALRCSPRRTAGGHLAAPRVSLLLNGVPLGALDIGPTDWQEVRLEVPESVWRLGTNRLTLSFPEAPPAAGDGRRPGLAVARVSMRYRAAGAYVAGGGRQREPRVATSPLGSSRLFVPGGSGVEYYLELPPGAVLAIDGIEGAGKLAVAIAPEGGHGAANVIGLLEPGSSQPPMRLGNSSWRPSRLSLLSWGRAEQELVLLNPRIVGG